MSFGPVTFVLLFLPGLVIVALVVLIALPRALRDERRLRERRCVKCGEALSEGIDRCPVCGERTRATDRADA
jgi:hypothetical protein